MKIAMGITALLLGSTLLGGAAYADHRDNNNDNNGYAPPPSWHVTTQPSHGSNPAPAPNNQGNAGNGHGNPGGHPGFHPTFAGQHGGQNQARWNHVVTFHDHNVAHFNAQDRSMWTHGQWKHTRHHGRDGWWWNTNGAWFFYDEPTYPYPESVSDDYSFDDDYADAPDQGGPGQNPYVWYYCSNPAGYYPYIQSCRGPWQPVTPTPPPGYDQGPQQQGGPDSYQDEDRGPPPGQQPRGQYEGPQGGPPPGYNGGDDDEDDQGPPPSGYNGDQGPPQGNGAPPGYNDQPPPR